MSLITIVNKTLQEPANSTTPTLTIPATVPGSALVLAMSVQNGGGDSIVSVAGGGTWVVVAASLGSESGIGKNTQFAYCLNPTPGTTTISPVLASPNNHKFYVWELNGVTVVGPASKVTNGGATTTPVGPSLGVGGFEAIVLNTVNTSSVTASSNGFTLDSVDSGAGAGFSHLLISAPGLYFDQFATGSSAYCSSGIVLSPRAGLPTSLAGSSGVVVGDGMSSSGGLN